MRTILRRIAACYPEFSRFNISVGLDCGFPLCSLSVEDLAAMYKFTKGELNFSCNAVLDIGPDMTVWPCFPLSSVKRKKVYDFNSFTEMQEYYNDFHNSITAEGGGIFSECDNCEDRARKLCAGGCKAHILNALGKENLDLRKLSTE